MPADPPRPAPHPRLRFAPSPSGRLHAGHAYAALFTWREAARLRGQALLRIEDIDHTRCRVEHIAGIEADLRWLGLDWPEPVRRQSEHMADFAAVLARLRTMGVVYPCFCTRAEIRAEIERSASAPHGPEGPLYPGTCRHLPADVAAARLAAGAKPAWRLDLDKALAMVAGARDRLGWHDLRQGRIAGQPELLGDAVLARRDIATSYHLAVVHDDALQGITHVTRGEDLFHATHLHVLLQALLGYPTPVYHHHPLIRDAAGQRLATRDHARTLATLREEGLSRDDVLKLIGMA